MPYFQRIAISRKKQETTIHSWRKKKKTHQLIEFDHKQLNYGVCEFKVTVRNTFKVLKESIFK
jgi:hypothetical protein